jgi:hypothetical protein
MAVYNARLTEPDPDNGEPVTFLFAATDQTGPDLFLPINRPGTDSDEAGIAALFDVHEKEGGGGILYMRIHRDWLSQRGAEFS